MLFAYRHTCPSIVFKPVRLRPLRRRLRLEGLALLAGWFSLAFMVLPIVITASEEALRAVPKGFREGSLALGATKFGHPAPASCPTRCRASSPPRCWPLRASPARPRRSCSPPPMWCATGCRGRSKWTDFVFQGVMALPVPYLRKS